MTRGEIEKSLAPDKYLNPFKAKEYIQFLLTSLTHAEEKVRELESKEAGARHFIEHELMKISPRLETKLKQTESSLTCLLEAVEGHKIERYGIILSNGEIKFGRYFYEADRALYQVVEGIRKGTK